MRALFLSLSRKTFRWMAVLGLVIVGSTALVRYAPGYLSDARELDSRYAAGARDELTREASRSASFWSLALIELRGALKGDFGTSRQYDLPVRSLLADRLPVTAYLLLRSIVSAWILSLSLALWSTVRPKARLIWRLPSAILLALPVSVLSTLSLLSDIGGPVLVVTLILAVRDFTQFQFIFRKALSDPHILHARSQGVRWHRMLAIHIGPTIVPQLTAVAGLSIVTALSVVIPVEVLFGIPGVGQLAWNAAMNRDLPVLLAVTAFMATIIASLTSLFGKSLTLSPEAA